MKKSIKKVAAALVATAMLSVILGGCGNAKNNAETLAETNKSETESTVQEADSEASDEKFKDVVIKIGATPGEDIQKRRDEYKVFQDYLERKTGLQSEIFMATDYASVVEAMRAGQVDVALYGPLSYVLAHDVANAEVFATDFKKSTGKFYEAYIITQPDSGIESITDLKGKSFAFVDPASTGGYLIPKKEMLQNGIDPDKDLASTVFAGGHDGCALAVKNRTVDAAAIVKHMYEKLMKEGLITEDDVKIIHTSAPFPSGAWAFRPDLDEELKEIIKDAVINVPEDEIEGLKPFMGSTEKYAPADDADWDPLREAAELINLDLTKQ